jgi:hypothetical protein
MLVDRRKLQTVLKGITVEQAYVAMVHNKGKDQVERYQRASCGKFLREDVRGIGTGKSTYKLFCGRVQQMDKKYHYFSPAVEYCGECIDKQELAKLNPEALRLRVYGAAPAHGGHRPIFTRATFLDQRYNRSVNVGNGPFNVNAIARDWAERIRSRRERTQERAQQAPEARQGSYRARRLAAARQRLLDGITRAERVVQKHKHRPERGQGSSYRPPCLFLGHEDAHCKNYPPDLSTQELRWRELKPARRKLGALIAKMRRARLGPANMYKALATLDYPLEQWGQFTEWQRERYGFKIQDDYWKWAYKVTGSGCVSRKPVRDTIMRFTIRGKYPTQEHERERLQEQITNHRKELEEHAIWLREHKSLQGTVEALREELRAFEEGQAGGRYVNWNCPLCNTPLERREGRPWCSDCEAYREEISC